MLWLRLSSAKFVADQRAELPSLQSSRREQRVPRGGGRARAATRFLRALRYVLFFHGRPTHSKWRSGPPQNELFRHSVIEVFNLLYYRSLMGLNAEPLGCLEAGDGGGPGVADWIRKVTRQWRQPLFSPVSSFRSRFLPARDTQQWSVADPIPTPAFPF